MRIYKLNSFLLLICIPTLILSCQNPDSLEDLGELEALTGEEETEPLVPFKGAPTQEELIKEHNVKIVQIDYDDGDYSISHYDKRGLMIKHEYFNGDSLSITEYSYELDKNGNILKEVQIEGDEQITFVNSYDQYGRKLSRNSTFSDGDTSVTTFEYDDRKRTKTEKDQYGKYITYFDERGLEEKMESYDTDGRVETTIHCFNDEAGNKIREESSFMGIDIVDKMTYNERGQLLRKERGGMVEVIMIYEYDEKGLCTKFDRQRGSAPSTSVYSYEYY